MVKINFALKALVLLVFVFSGSVFAISCAQDAYRKSCANCPFDNETGKMDTACYKNYQSGGTGCVASSFPIAAMQYSKGNCSGIDACAEMLTACKAGYTLDNDKMDCEGQGVPSCFADADKCVENAAKACEGNPLAALPDTKMCPVGLILMAGLLFAAFAIRS